MPEGGAAGAEDEVEGVAAAFEEEVNGGAEAARELVDEGFALGKEQVGAFDELAHGEDVGKASLRIARAVHPVAELGFGVLKIVERDVDAVALDEVAADILPEVGELESGADVVGEAEEIGLCFWRVAVEHQDDAADGIRAAGAVIEQLIPGFVASDALILLEGEDEVFERRERKRLGADGVAELFENGMVRIPCGAEAEFLASEFEEAEGAVMRGFADALGIGKIVDEAAVVVDSREMGAEIGGDERAEDGEVFLIAGGGERREDERLRCGVDEGRG